GHVNRRVFIDEASWVPKKSRCSVRRWPSTSLVASFMYAVGSDRLRGNRMPCREGTRDGDSRNGRRVRRHDVAARPVEAQPPLIPGGSRGIGKGIALSFAQAGADLLLSARSMDDL